MTAGVSLRVECPADRDAIHALTTEAFAPMPYADGDEGDVIDRLREAGDLTLSLVAERSDRIVGHVAFSPARVGGEEGWIGLGPISVAPDCQRQGIGTALAHAGLDRLRDRAKGCVLVGRPAVYGPMGFRSGGLSWRDHDPDIAQWIAFHGQTPRGEITFAPALEGS